MNEREQLKVAQIMNKAYDFHLSKYHYLFLTQMAIRQYELKVRGREEPIEKTAQKIMEKMPKLCEKTEGLKHKRIVETSSSKSIERLEFELYECDSLGDELLRGEALKNILSYLIED